MHVFKRDSKICDIEKTICIKDFHLSRGVKWIFNFKFLYSWRWTGGQDQTTDKNDPKAVNWRMEEQSDVRFYSSILQIYTLYF